MDSKDPTKLPFTHQGAVMIAIGAALLLLPGGCSVYFLIKVLAIITLT